MPLTKLEKRWLGYAWRVVNCPQSHLDACRRAGAAVPGPSRVDGNDMRLPGYLGRNYRSGGIICVAAVSREPSLEDEKEESATLRTNNAKIFQVTREWIKNGRSRGNDALYLESIRSAYENALPKWPRWTRHFKSLVVDYLKMDVTEVIWTNLAKCRVPIDRGSKARQAEARLTRLCQRKFIPMREIVDIVRPTAVLVCVLNAGQNGDIVDSWDGERCRPLVYSWQGQSGHDRHNTHPERRKLHEWAPEMAREVRRRLKCSGRI